MQSQKREKKIGFEKPIKYEVKKRDFLVSELVRGWHRLWAPGATRQSAVQYDCLPQGPLRQLTFHTDLPYSQVGQNLPNLTQKSRGEIFLC